MPKGKTKGAAPKTDVKVGRKRSASEANGAPVGKLGAGAETEAKAAKKKTDGKPAVLSGQPPEWASAAAIARLIGKSVRRVQQLTQEGILQTEQPPGGGARKYKTCETMQAYIAHVKQKAEERGESGGQAELALRKLQAEIDLKESQGELHKLKTDIAKGHYIAADKAAEDMADFMLVFRKFTDNIPSRMAGVMASYTDPAMARAMEKSMKKELDAMLTLFADAASPARTEEAKP